MQVGIFISRVAAAGLALLLIGCVGPATRAREWPASLRGLAPSDRQLVLGGRIREGFGQDAVYLAWGAPNHVSTFHVGRRTFEFWFYTQVQYGVAGGYFGVSRDFHFPGGHAVFDDGTNGRADFYEAPIYSRGLTRPETEVPYKKAVFEHGRVVSFETLRGVDSPAGPGTSGAPARSAVRADVPRDSDRQDADAGFRR